MREKYKAPVVHLVKLGAGCYAGETSDGKLLIENVPNQCCKWAAKFEILHDWCKENVEGYDEESEL